MYFIILLWIAEIFITFAFHIFCKNMLGVKCKNKLLICVTWFLYLIIFYVATYMISDSTILNATMSISLFLIVEILLYKGSVKLKMLYAVLQCVLGAVSEIIIMGIWGVLAEIFLIELTMEDIFVIIATMSKLLIFVFLKVITLMGKKKEYAEIRTIDWIETFFVPLFSIFIILTILSEMKIYTSFNVLLSIVCILAINIFTYLLYEKIRQNTEDKMMKQLLEQQCHYYLEQCKEIEDLWVNLRSFRHDMKQRYIVEQIHLKTGEYDLLQKSYEEVNYYIGGEVLAASTGNIYFDALINYKAGYAKKLGIEVLTELQVPSDWKIKENEASILLGNLFDNAIEATKEVTDRKKEIHLKIKYDANNLLIIMRNPYKGDRCKNKQGDYMTTNENKEEHGAGIKIMNGIIRKHNGDMEILEQDNDFIVKILVYNMTKQME